MENPQWIDNFSPSYQNISYRKFKLLSQIKEYDEQNVNKVNTGLVCSYCKGKIEEDTYYRCRFHKNLFCFNCATKKGEHHPDEFAKCPQQRSDHKECIWEKREYKGDGK